MPDIENYAVDAPQRGEIDALPGLVLLEFGVDWCPHCQGAQAPIAEALSGIEAIQRLKIEDGPGRPLGRSFCVKLWPTLILLRQGQEVGRSVRPTTVGDVQTLLGLVSSA